MVYYEMSGETRRAHRSWYRGKHTNFHPVRASLAEPDAFANHVGKGWLPPAPFIDKNTYIAAFGSCFAAHVTKFLAKEGYNVFGRNLRIDSHIVRSGEGIVNTAALRQQFEWALAGAAAAAGQWHDKAGVELEVSETVRKETHRIFEETEVFILTLGLSEIWYDKETGAPFWKGVPKDSFDDTRHGFRVIGVAENLENLERVRELIRAHRPEATIVLTLSPVPLAATFRPVSCITANAVSKASLRMAIDELMRAHEDDERLFYFPSYEMITAFLPDPYEDDLRHPKPAAVNEVMRAFQAAYLR
ncbi:GSCFA domain-containing protein [Rhodobacter ferrooxidans]|nr:GSCFA domain-containing protein [Rhodobacter sp. SW2]